MKFNQRALLAFGSGLVFAFSILSANAGAICPSPWVCENVSLNVPYSLPALGELHSAEKIRAGYYPAKGTFRGNVLYFEGLGDSMLNHAPLVEKLSEAGFRVIAFDYMGQGGSSGKMDRTRIRYIPWIGERIWNRYAQDLKNFPKKSVIGWSTGGLAAYLMAALERADTVVLIAPGLVPNMSVGDGLVNWLPNKITLESLTTAAPYSAGEKNPHVDPIRPNSGMKAPNFAMDLFSTAHEMRGKSVPTPVRGFVLLSGDNDTYVNAEKTRKLLPKIAPHFEVTTYVGALHEIDNEQTTLGESARQDIVDFLSSGL